MKRYFLVNEYFGSRIYDSVEKKEQFYNHEETEKMRKELEGNYNEINNVRENQFSAPMKISMNLTKKCNLRCKQCFSDSGELRAPELTTQDMYNLFDDMAESGTFYICLGGGEPLTRPDLLDILAYGKKKQLAVSIVSNGLLLTKELIEKLNEMDLDYFWVSFEGEKENHEALRGNGTFDRTVNALKLLQDHYKGRTALRMSLNKNNLADCEAIVRMAEKYDIDLVRFTPILDFGRAKNENLTISQDQYIKFLADIKNIKSETVKIVYPNQPNDNKIWIGSNGFGCHCGKEAIWVDEVGTINPCIFWGEEFNIGNVKDTKILEMWDKCLAISTFEGNEVCLTCPHYRVCRGGCRARVQFMLGNLNDVDPLCPLKRNKK